MLKRMFGRTSPKTEPEEDGKEGASSLYLDTRRADVAHVYHEKQKQQRCGIHSVNNLLGAAVHTKKSFDAICTTLAARGGRGGALSINPHKSFWGTGNYDVNVLTLALAERKLAMDWFNASKSVEDIPLDEVRGFILHMPPSGWLGSGHWRTVKQVDGRWLDLDSQQEWPHELRDVRVFLQHYIKTRKALLFVVTDVKEEPQGDAGGDEGKEQEEVAEK
jgi:josephin